MKDEQATTRHTSTIFRFVTLTSCLAMAANATCVCV